MTLPNHAEIKAVTTFTKEEMEDRLQKLFYKYLVRGLWAGWIVGWIMGFVTGKLV